jgi:hypothetical protein
MKGLRIGIAAAVLAAGITAPAPARAGFLEDAGWGSLTVLSNVFYMPAKIVYSAVGGVTGGLAWACTLGDTELAEKVWVTSMAGTYVITPRMLQGEDSVHFAGTPDSSKEADVNHDDPPALSEQGLSGS